MAAAGIEPASLSPKLSVLTGTLSRQHNKGSAGLPTIATLIIIMKTSKVKPLGK